ncbi:DUF1761 family protein [Actinomycetospora termitidis]|uniref:DUF1761 family protein n=1 Tax=Actinomycetospora termitidis TaxID=3053470 RepID=A0ABT7M873_9PSEU|nr:DUF1761 family protein [Actinomycetospora sp. Odt1-22]MDL5156237.1 DUF1761 family protein [Actinomycetospora sp. Odt1-22]
MTVVAVGVAAVAVFIISSVYYAVLGARLARWSPAYATPRPAGLTVVVELVRNVVLASVVAGFFLTTSLGTALLGALALWVAFPLVLLTGSVYHERTDPRLAVVHAGDWLVKVVVVTLVVVLLA